MERIANEFFGQFNTVKTDINNPCDVKLSFLEFRKDMKEVALGVYKKVLEAGSGDVIDVWNSIITYEFAMFLEGSMTPFDSSFVKNRPEIIKRGSGILPGIVYAVSTMKQGEAADFWIHSDHMFGRNGNFINGFSLGM